MSDKKEVEMMMMVSEMKRENAKLKAEIDQIRDEIIMTNQKIVLITVVKDELKKKYGIEIPFYIEKNNEFYFYVGANNFVVLKALESKDNIKDSKFYYINQKHEEIMLKGSDLIKDKK